MQTGAANTEDDLNSIRSQLKRILGEANWYTALSGRSLSVLSTDLLDIENKMLVCNATVLTDVVVPASQNWKILSVAGSEAPTEVASVATTVEGAIVRQSALNGAGFNVHETIVVTGPNALNPANLLLVRDYVTKQPIQSSGRDVFGLLQYESTGVDGAAFNDTSAGNRVKISFVRINAAGTALEAVPVADIENQTIEYNYNFRRKFDNVDQNCFLSSRGFVDQAASVDVTLDNAVDNQVGKVTQNKNIEVTLGGGFRWEFEDATQATLIQVVEGSGGAVSTFKAGVDLDFFDIDAVDNDFANGIKVRTGGTRAFRIGVVDGVIETVAGDFGLHAFTEFDLVDGNKAGSSFSGQLKLSETAAEWSAYETEFGEVSLLNAIVQANSGNSVQKTTARVTADTAANADVGGVGGGTNLDAQLHDLSGGNFIEDHDVFLNGQILRGGADASANFDYYPGTSLANGQLKFEFNLKGSGSKKDLITVISRA